MLNSPKNITLSKLLLCLSIIRFNYSKWFEIKFWWGLYNQFTGHILFLKLTAFERVSMLHLDLPINNLDSISLQMYRRSPPPFPFLPHLYGTSKPLIWNWTIVIEPSCFVSDIRSKSILLTIMYGKFFKHFSDWINIKMAKDCLFLHHWHLFCRRCMKHNQCWNWRLMSYVIFKRDI